MSFYQNVVNGHFIMYAVWSMWLLLLAAAASARGQDWQLVWSDEFDGDSIDISKWEHEVTAWGGGVSERHARVVCMHTVSLQLIGSHNHIRVPPVNS